MIQKVVFRISVAFCCAADGTRLPPLILLPRKKPIPDFIPPTNVIVLNKPSGNFDTQTIVESFFQRVLIPHILRNNLKNPIIYFDRAPCHFNDVVKTYLSKNNIEFEFFPPRLTNVLQPADIVWFKSLKSAYKNLWSDWYVNEDKAFTKQGNLKSPGYARSIGWISQIW